MVLEKKHESSKDLGNNKETNNVKSSTNTELAATNIMERTDTDDSDVDIVNINKFGAKKTFRWIGWKLMYLWRIWKKCQHAEAREYPSYKKRKPKVRWIFFYYWLDIINHSCVTIYIVIFRSIPAIITITHIFFI